MHRSSYRYLKWEALFKEMVLLQGTPYFIIKSISLVQVYFTGNVTFQKISVKTTVIINPENFRKEDVNRIS